MNEIRNDKLRPFLKWPGGKRWLINRYDSIFPKEFSDYYEPFLGGGSVFFDLRPQKATISDINIELINLYRVMRDYPHNLKNELIEHQRFHSEDYYYSTRCIEPVCNINRASRFLYLNRTCYNGMYRVNKQGKFNVPLGTKSNCIYDIDKFELYSKAFKNVDILSCDFSETIKKACESDLLFVDPPYTVSKNQKCFTRYNEKLFSWEDQIRLFNNLVDAKSRGVKVISTNVFHNDIIEMYINNGFCVNTLNRFSSLSGKISNRCNVEELLITSYSIEL